MTDDVAAGTTAAQLRTRMRTATVAERQQKGEMARERRPRSSLGAFAKRADRPDPIAMLAAQETSRVQALLPLRHSRMSASPFTFYRGGAVIMASDLAAMPNTGLVTQLCGDAHLSNFGVFAAPDRSLVFDINDFDETNPGPFEWDVYRLATSFVLAGGDVHMSEETIRNAVMAVGFAYRTQMVGYSAMTDLDLWYDRIGVDVIMKWAKSDGFADAEKRIEKGATKARSRDAWSAISKMTEVVDGRRQFLNTPPLLIRIPLDHVAADRITRLVGEYQDTLPRDRQLLLNQYHVIDAGHKVVGVGSVGLLAFVILMQGRDENDLLVLQAKQAVTSVLEPYTGSSIYPLAGERVVVGQQVMQAASDVFLGWVRGNAGRDFYVRQLRDMKFAPDPATFDESAFLGFAIVCGRTLARAHARAGDSVAIAGYLGTSAKFDKAIRDFALAYAEQVKSDYAAYQAAISAGAVTLAEEGEAERYSVVVDPTAGLELVADSVAAAGSGAEAGPAST
jgi:uncharacterized protein (DUF2252 family)